MRNINLLKFCLLVALSTTGLYSCNSNQKKEDARIVEEKTFPIVQEQEKIDNSWLIGSWGPAILEGVPPIIEYIQFELTFLDEYTLVESSLTKLTRQGVIHAQSRDPYRGSSDIKLEQKKYSYSIDNEMKELTYNTDPERRNRQSYEMRIYFDKATQTLNIGSKNKPTYIRKQSSTYNLTDIEYSNVEIIGIWQDTQNEYNLPSIQFNENGSAYYDISSDCFSNGTYTLNDNNISFIGTLNCSNNSNDDYNETFILKGHTLIRKDGIILTKKN